MVTAITPIASEHSALQPKFIRVKDGALYCGLSESELYRAIYSGELRAMRYRSRSWLITREDIDAWIDSNSVPNVA